MERLKKFTKRTLAVLMIVVAVIGIAPLNGFVEKDWSEFVVGAVYESDLTVTNVENADLYIDGKQVKSIGMEKVTIIEGTNGYMVDSDYNGKPIEPYFYYTEIEPASVTILFVDGTSEKTNYEDFYERISDFFDGCCYGCFSEQEEDIGWPVGKHTGIFGREGEFTLEYIVEIVENNIESVEIKDIYLIKDYSSELKSNWICDDNGNEEFVKWYGYNTRPVMLKINYKDGTSKECTYDDLRYDTDFYCYYHDNQSYDNQWDVGEYSAYLDFGVQTYEYSVIIGELKEIKAYPIEIVEGTKGAYHSYSYAGETYYFEDYIYSYDLFTIYNLTFQDGKNAELNYTELENLGSVGRIDTQWDENWGIGKHVGNVSLYTYDENEEDDIEFYSIEVDVTIIETPINRIVIAPLDLVEWVDGEWGSYGCDHGEFSYFAYDYAPREITVFYKNGETITGSLADFEDEKNNISMTYHTFDSGCDDSWLPGNVYKVGAAFMGVMAEYDVNIIANTTHSHSFVTEIVEGTCFDNGWIINRCDCGKFSAEIIDSGHIDENNDNICDRCGDAISDDDYEDEDYTLAETGQCGENVYWNYNNTTGELIISGTGPMFDHDRDNEEIPDDYSPFYCSDIKSVVIQEGVTTIGNDAFLDCEYLETVEIPDSITKIGNGAFSECSNLSSVKIPSAVVSIGAHAFSYCYDLSEVEIPVSVVSVYWAAFHECTNLLNVYYGGSENEWNNIYFDESNDCLFEADIHYNSAIHTHSYTSKITTPATCTKAGVKTYTCSCGDSYTEAISATGHKETTLPAKAATCTKTGLTSGKKCTVCGTITAKQQTIKATGHKEVTVAGKAATYTSTGLTAGKKCSVCGKITVAQQTVAKLTLGKVSGLKAKKIKVAKSSEITLAWNKVAGAKSYEVYQKSGSKWKKIKTTSSTSYTVKKLKADKEYQFRVRAVVDGASGAYSSTLKVETIPETTSLKLKAGSKQLTASWSKVSDISGYEIQYSTSKKMKSAKKVSAKKSAKKTTIKKLTKGKKYYVRVRTYKTVNGKKIFSDWSAVKNVKVK